jgi:hypothetical protein
MEEDVKQYMVGMPCPAGLPITPERMWLYRDFYTARSPASVKRVGEFNARAMWRQPPPSQGEAFEVFVQQWLGGPRQAASLGISQAVARGIPGMRASRRWW